MYQYLLYDKKIWLNTRSNYIDNKHFCTSPRLNRSHLCAILADLKEINLEKNKKKLGRGRFRGSGGDDHQ